MHVLVMFQSLSSLCLHSFPDLTDAAMLKATLTNFNGGVAAKRSKCVPVVILMATRLHSTSSDPVSQPLATNAATFGVVSSPAS